MQKEPPTDAAITILAIEILRQYAPLIDDGKRQSGPVLTGAAYMHFGKCLELARELLTQK